MYVCIVEVILSKLFLFCSSVEAIPIRNNSCFNKIVFEIIPELEKLNSKLLLFETITAYDIYILSIRQPHLTIT